MCDITTTSAIMAHSSFPTARWRSSQSLVTSASLESLASGDDFSVFSPPRGCGPNHTQRSSPPLPLPTDATLGALWESRPLVTAALGEWLGASMSRSRRRYRRRAGGSSPSGDKETEEDEQAAISDVSDAEGEDDDADGASGDDAEPAAAVAAADKDGRESAFDCVEPPAMPAVEYAARLARYSYASPPCLVLATVYMDRVARRDASLALSPLNVHRLLLAALGVAAKVHDDAAASARHYALVGGVEADEVAALEMELLLALDWRTFVSEAEYARQLRTLVWGAGAVAVAAAIQAVPAHKVDAKARALLAPRPPLPMTADNREHQPHDVVAVGGT